MRSDWLLAALAVPGLAVPAFASAQTTVKTAADVRSAPNGRLVATLHAGAHVTPGATRGAWTRITLDGYVTRSALGGKRDTFTSSAIAGGAILRDAPSKSGAIVARLEGGAGLDRVARSGAWEHVRRSGWVLTKSLATVSVAHAGRTRKSTRTSTVARATTPKPPPPPPAPAVDTATGDTAEPTDATPLAAEHRITLRLAPDGPALATLDSSTRVTTMARDRGWVRVSVEGWVRATDLMPIDTTVLTAVSAADLRAQPDKFRGQVVRWQVQKIALETADPLRRGMAPDEPYLLARGPGDENSLLYLALPPSLVDQARRIDPLATLIVTARVRDGRSEPAGVPLLDVESIVQR